MEIVLAEREAALRALRSAGHLLTQTYPIIGDPKLLLAALQQIWAALEHSMNCLLAFDRELKRIPRYGDELEARLAAFTLRCAPLHGLKAQLALLAEVRELLARHKAAAFEFSRKAALVLCDENFKLSLLTADQLMTYLSRAKIFLTACLKPTLEVKHA